MEEINKPGWLLYLQSVPLKKHNLLGTSLHQQTCLVPNKESQVMLVAYLFFKKVGGQRSCLMPLLTEADLVIIHRRDEHYADAENREAEADEGTTQSEAEEDSGAHSKDDSEAKTDGSDNKETHLDVTEEDIKKSVPKLEEFEII